MVSTSTGSNGSGRSHERKAGDSPRLSLCMIVKNEENCLPSCLESVRGVVDEIIVVDTGSTDRTEELAKAAGATILHFTWCHDFAAARNVALDAATGDWILVLDADEQLAPGTGAAIRNAIADPTINACRLRVINDKGPALAETTWLVRLYRNHPDIRYVRRIHESVHEALFELNRQTGRTTADLAVDILHSGYRPEVFTSKNKRERNLQLHERTVADRPDDAYAWYRFGDELRAVDNDRAALALETAWRLLMQMPRSRRVQHVYAGEVATLLGFLQLQGGAPERALSILARGIQELGTTPNLVYVRALCHTKLKMFPEALADYEYLYSIRGKRFDAPVQPGITDAIAMMGAADCLMALSNPVAAELKYQMALQFQPASSRAQLGLARARVAAGKSEEAREGLDSYLKTNPKDGAAWALSGSLALDGGSPEAAVQRLRIAASAAGAPEGVYGELAVALAAGGNVAEAAAVMQNVMNPESLKYIETRIQQVLTMTRERNL